MIFQLDLRAVAELPPPPGRDGLPRFSLLAYRHGAMSGGSQTPTFVDLAGLTSGDTVPVFLNGDLFQLVGQAEKVVVLPSAIHLAGVFTGGDDDPIAQRIITHHRNGFQWRGGLGLGEQHREFLGAGQSAMVNGQAVNGPAVIVRRSHLRGASFLGVGDESTSASIAASI